jgi:hypothetical protein
MINPVQKLPHLNRREALQTVGATVALATAASGSLTRKGAHRRRMMVVSLHDRISGHAGRVRALDRFLTYGKGKKDLWFAPKDEIARYVLANRADTPVVDRGFAERHGPARADGLKETFPCQID